MMPHIKYQGFRPCGFRLRFFHAFPISAFVKHVTPGAGPFLAPGHYLNKLGRGPLLDATYQISRL